MRQWCSVVFVSIDVENFVTNKTLTVVNNSNSNSDNYIFGWWCYGS